MKEVIINKNDFLTQSQDEPYVCNHLIRLELKENDIPVKIPLTNLKDDSISVSTGRIVCYDDPNHFIFRWYSDRNSTEDL